MALQDMPHLPPEYVPRVVKLVNKVKNGEAAAGDILGRILGPALESMLPVLMRTGGPQIAALMPQVINAIPSLFRQQVFVKIKSGGCYMVKIGFRPKLFQFVPSSLDEIKSSGVPGIVVDPGKTYYMIQGFDGIVYALAEGVVSIYGLNELLGILRDSSGNRLMADILPTILSLLTSELLLSMQEPIQTAVDELFATYGV